MTFLNTLASEWTKLRTTRSFWWTTALFLFFSLGWAAMQGNFTPEAEAGIPPLWASTIVLAVYSFGFTVLIIQAVMVVTTEYRYNLQSVSYLASPQRWLVALAKLVMYVVIAAVLTFLAVIVSYYLAKLLAPASAAELFHPFEDEQALRLMWVYPVAAVMLMTFAQGIALLLRQTTGAVALMLIWFMGVEALVGIIPRVGDRILSYLPMENLEAFINDAAVQNAPWGAGGSGLYFAAWAVALWILGVVALERRDA